MKTLYLDCGMGAAGDMLTAALLELLPDPDGFVRKLNDLGIPGVVFEKEQAVKCGITGTHMKVTVHGVEEGETHDHGHDHEHDHEHDHHDHVHHHASLHDVEHIVRDHLKLSEKVRNDVLAVYRLIAEAESHVHGRPVTEIHFHEVGTMDAIADVTAVCLLIERLAPEQIIASPIHVGSGEVKCAHGILPVPAPATAFLLRDVPIYGGEVRGELCTPTGAALLKHFCTAFGDMPMMRVQRIGYGMGKKEFPRANCVRAMLGEPFKTDGHGQAADMAGNVRQAANGRERERDVECEEDICELDCNVDDMTGEAVGFAMERLFEAGARDVFTVPIGMKKNRPGLLLCVICTENEKKAVIQAIFKHTTTIGIRENRMHRYILERSMETLQTPYGEVHCKVSRGYGVERRKPEYEDLARIAREKGMNISKVREQVVQSMK